MLTFSDDLISFLQYSETHNNEFEEIVVSASEESFARPDMNEVKIFDPILKIYEMITRHTFPAIKPKKAWITMLKNTEADA